MLKKRVIQIIILLKIYLYKILFWPIRKKVRDYWIISERGVDARDNGYFLYKYIKENRADIRLKYVISKDSVDFNKISKEDIVYYKSWSHYLYFLYGKVLISTHIMGFTPDMGLSMKLNSKNLLPIYGKTIFLQHGITKDYSKLFDYNYTKLNLFCCAAFPEFDFIKEKNKYTNKVIKLTGFPRFDSLRNIGDKKKILIMPTWRHWHNNLNDELFMKESFYLEYSKLLNDNQFIDYIERKDLQVYFYLHHETQKFSKLFHTISKNITICNKKEYDVQTLLNECGILITDYSSVYFDVAYIRKPVIYFHFDFLEYRRTHPEGYFSYDKDGFGPVINNCNELIKCIIENGFDLKEEYLRRIDSFFPSMNVKNSERVVDCIEEVLS